MSHELTALYERLSHDDELQDESNSISNHQTISVGVAVQCVHSKTTILLW